MREQRNFMFARTGFIHSSPRIDRRPSKLIKLDSFIEHAISPSRNGFCHCLFSEFNCFIAFENHFSTWPGVGFVEAIRRWNRRCIRSDTCLHPGWVHGATFHMPYNGSLFCNFPWNFTCMDVHEAVLTDDTLELTIGRDNPIFLCISTPRLDPQGLLLNHDRDKGGSGIAGCSLNSLTFFNKALALSTAAVVTFDQRMHNTLPYRVTCSKHIHTSQRNAFHLFCRYVVLRQYTLDADTSSMLNQQLLPLPAALGDTFTVACKIFVQD